MATNEELKAKSQHAAQQSKADVQEGARKIADTARETAADVRDNLSDVAETARERAAEVADRARHEAERAYRLGQEKAGEVAEYAGEYYDDLTDMVRRKPGQALGIAAGVGFLLGLILSRR